MNSFTFNDRLTLIIYHYFFGPIFGFRLRIFSPDRHFSAPDCFVASGIYGGLVALFAISILQGWHLASLGFLLLLTCPQWLYALYPVQHTIFEYRAPQFALGFSCILLEPIVHWHSLIPLYGLIAGYIGSMARERNSIYTDSLLFWKQAHLDVRSDPMLLSAYIYQLNKREKFSLIDDLHAWLIEQQIPDCRALLINIAVSKLGSTGDNSTLDVHRLKDAERLLQEVVSRWPDHADGYRNLGTIQYYLHDFNKAAATFLKAIDLSPRDSLSWLCLGHVRLEQKRYEDAANCLRCAYNYIPAGAYLVQDISLIQVKLMEALELCGQWDELQHHQAALFKHNAYFVTDENAKFIV